MSEETELVRPSSLPKLAVCRCFVGKEGTSEAAERGTRLDAAIRKAVAAGTSVDPADVDCVDEDIEACNWAIDELKTLQLSGKWETRESELQAVVPVEGVKPGTMDALNVEDATLADFKTGQVRNYREQMAAYALACMDAYFEDRWTCFLLFVDAKEVVTHIFTREEAEAIVIDVLMAKRKENPCEYCAWCARFDGECSVYGACGAVKAANAEVMNADLPKPTPALLSHPDEWPESVKELAKDHAKAFHFLQCLGIADKWGDQIKTELKKQDQLPPRYFKRVTMSGQRKVLASKLGPLVEKWGVDAVLSLCDTIPLSKFEAVWKAHEGEDTPIPDDLVGTFGGSVQLRLGTGEDPKPKKETKKETK